MLRHMTALPPLHGLRILDASRLLPGPACTRLLADLGADVVRVDHPEVPRGDMTRMLPPFAVTTQEGAPVDDAQGMAFIALNHGKRSIAIDLRSPEGVERFLTLAAEADVVVESFRPGVLDRLGAGWAAIHAANPATILCSITGYGQAGPRAEQAGHDIGYLAAPAPSASPARRTACRCRSACRWPTSQAERSPPSSGSSPRCASATAPPPSRDRALASTSTSR